MQTLLRKGAKQALFNDDQMKYHISLQHEELKHALLNNENAVLQVVYVDRTIEGLEDALTNDPVAANFQDVVKCPVATLPKYVDREIETTHKVLKKSCMNKLHSSRVFKHT
jgi:hypothetical protein